MRQQRPNVSEVNTAIAYLLWALGCFGCCGVHRFYLGKYFSGFIYLFTFGLFGLGQFIDLFFIPSMVEERNYYIWAKLKANDPRYFTNIKEEVLRNNNAPETTKKEIDPLVKLLKAAANNNNVLSVGQAIIAMELPKEQVQKLLNQAVRQELAHIDNEPETGAVRYYFDI